MAGHDDQEGVPAQRLAHGARQAARAEAVGDLAVRQRRARPGWSGRRRRRACGTPARRPCRAAAPTGPRGRRPAPRRWRRAARRIAPGGGPRARPGAAAARARACRPRAPRATARRGCHPGPTRWRSVRWPSRRIANSVARHTQVRIASTGACRPPPGACGQTRGRDVPEPSHVRHFVVASRW